jgi:hypothetical protein
VDWPRPGSFLGILKDLHHEHCHPNLPFSLFHTEYGLGVKACTSSFEELSKSLVGYARLIPTSLVSNRRQHSQSKRCRPQKITPTELALINCISIIKCSDEFIFVCYGPLAFANHHCGSRIMLGTPFDDNHVPKVGKTYKWRLQERENVVGNPRPLCHPGDEFFLFYGPCGIEDDFECELCET